MPTSINPMQLVQMIKGGSNPQQLLLQMMEQQTQDNPVLQNLLNLARGNKTKEIEQFARNIAKEKGLDFDKEFNSFKQTFGFK